VSGVPGAQIDVRLLDPVSTGDPNNAVACYLSGIYHTAGWMSGAVQVYDAGVAQGTPATYGNANQPFTLRITEQGPTTLTTICVADSASTSAPNGVTVAIPATRALETNLVTTVEWVMVVTSPTN